MDALFVWYNLYYELTVSIRKLSGLLRCHGCDDWPKLGVRSNGIRRKPMAEQVNEGDVDESSVDESDAEEIESSDDESDNVDSLSEVSPGAF